MLYFVGNTIDSNLLCFVFLSNDIKHSKICFCSFVSIVKFIFILITINYCNQIKLSCHFKELEKSEMLRENHLCFLEVKN
jgi:hypothetical protein